MHRRHAFGTLTRVTCGVQLKALMDKNTREQAAADTAPSLDEMLRLVSMRSDQLQRSVTLHRQSMHHGTSGGSLPAPLELGSGAVDRK